MRTVPKAPTIIVSGAMVLSFAQVLSFANAPAPPSTGDLDPRIEEKIERTIEAVKRDYEARIAALEREVAALKTAQASPPRAGGEPAARTAAPADAARTAAPGTATPGAAAPGAAIPGAATPETATPEAATQEAATTTPLPAPPSEPLPSPPPSSSPGAAPQTANYFNPSIAVIGNYLGVGGTNHTENLPSSSLRESELSLQAVVDPYARADFFLSYAEEGVEVEEGFITFTTLPWDLLAKVGRMRVGFGKTNPLHLHVLPWPDEPLPVVNLLGGNEGWVGTGVSVARLIPMPAEIFSELTLQVLSGDAEGLFEAPSRGDLAYAGRYRLFRDLSEATNLDVGLSYGFGPNGTTEHASTTLEGIDATLRWKPLRTASYRSAVFRGELMQSTREQPGGEQRALGWFLSGEYQLARRWFAGARVERAERAADASQEDRGLAGLITFWPSEFSQLRTELRRRTYAEGETADEVLLQIQFAIGAHGAHPF